ncbi:uncharacterized protein QC763_210970 [Podospora pseudopauciseta]|uniref:DNA (cytosine-5)-methyltransferase 1 replication foci domain-containing protein n=1 Tax=Podospora pseudopauciseta TaxID=2093780 RepID=A0ABR0HRH1_9PEZI|nr:hypothetical protein QC763_210970 [Podospora pseudopauciseta]
MPRPGRPGRSRRSESVDHDSVHYVKESAALTSVELGPDEGEWPCFVLSDAIIYRKDGKTLANPLMVHSEGPLVIRGLLEIDKETKKYVKIPVVKGVHLEITDSTKYSISDEPFALWVSGTSGWFEIQPSRKYLPMYREVAEAANLYYRVFVAHDDHHKLVKLCKKSGRKQPPPLSLDQIFLHYAVKIGSGIVRDEVEALCDKWAEFFISHFKKENQLDWKPTRFAQWLISKHPASITFYELEKRVEDAAKGLPIPVPPPPQLEDSEDEVLRMRRKSKAVIQGQDVDMVEVAPTRSQKLPSRPISQSQSRPVESPVPLPEKYLNIGKPTLATPQPLPQAPSQSASPAAQAVPDSPVDRLLGILDEVVQDSPDLHARAPSTIFNMVYFKAKIKDYRGSREILSYYAKDLFPRLDPNIWAGTPFHTWLEATSRNWDGQLLHVREEEIPSQMYRRGRIGPRAPRAPQQPSAPTTSNRNVVSGKRSTLRPGPSSKKRPASDLYEDEDEYDSRCGKRSFTQSFEGDNLDHDDDDEDSDDSVETEVNPELATPDDPASLLPLPAGASRIVIQAERLPTLSPSGPNGSWVCPNEECGYVVRSADEPGAQEIIEEHFRAHEYNTQKIDLALTEGRRGHLPIDNLLAKIREKGKESLKKKRGVLGGKDNKPDEKAQVFRDRVKTRLLV